MPQPTKNFSAIDTRKVKKLANFKLDYGKVRILEYIDKGQKKLKAFKNFITVFPRITIQIEELLRPAFSSDMSYLKNFSAFHYSNGKIIAAVGLGPFFEKSRLRGVL